jgi:6-phosphogluconolactonase (cycloisomerase 2 family)
MRCSFAWPRRAALFSLGTALLAAGCKDSYWYGNGPGAAASVTTPSGIQTGAVRVDYKLTGDPAAVNVAFSFSTNGITFRDATAATGGDGTSGLSVSPAGDAHVFVWDSVADLNGAREPSVIVKVAPADGTSGKSDAFAVRNARFLAAVEKTQTGSARLYKLEVSDGSLSFLQTVATGGTDPVDILFQSGLFLLAHQTSNSVAVLKVDEDTSTLSPVAGSPFSADGTGAKYLATDGSHVFLSNTGSETISIFDLNTSTGALTRASGSGAAAAGCRGLAVVSGRLYVASETAGQVLVFDIGSGGTLLANAASPVTAGGLASPRALAVAGTRLYAASASAATIAGFNVLSDGSLAALSGSPFTVSSSGLEEIQAGGTKLFGVTGDGSALIATTLDGSGVLSEDVGSPLGLAGPSFGVRTAGAFVVAGTTTSKDLTVWSVDSGGSLVRAASSPFSAGIEVLRLALWD